MTDEQFKSIISRLSNIEHHMINYIIPLQGIHDVFTDKNILQELIRGLQNPIKVETGNLKLMLNEFYETARRFLQNIESLKSLDQFISETKFIGKRLSEIESTLEIMKKDGIRRNLHLELTMDGYEMVKKPVMYDAKDPVEEPNKAMTAMLESIMPQERLVLMHRYGLLGEKKKTLEATGKLIKVSLERVRQIECRALRKLRHPSRFPLVHKTNHKALKKAVTGDE